ncbi:ABC transporter substrate-binding protein [Variovorax paradoxus]|jgi:tripartite-type tricarboxylate transporter receptor subunit TctC|uniref:Bug family tripartite tricarboxylate transporter substrate binding protein n=1 Tax=Variovorax TaxID=34072 RepID=UPI0006E4DAC5|nr:tripartite tricarboxylate transporter substrate binding protein [Variovorax sp. CY25R-8]KPU97535.1 ABC transporter substrate-binding protein [Variovorax paradoxus]KPV06957.1 ABC transporter substrate-binding protein [Variovorax paradoxus]KPV07164.1 ABC transporter substrate-binding protein [Variovorax paradoxus]KPV20703.1 ABC transporter substrate-binding protein [Variovorax paradoxus]KPV31353.1 ABC transporter substrate-binding protein [Variovorax paradoxus]
MITGKKLLQSVAAATMALAVSALAVAQTAYPAKPVRWVVGYPAGGGTDFLARTVGAQVSQQLGQPVLVDNRPGAGAIIASENVARSAGDGYTVFSADNGVLVYNPALYKKLPYDAEKDFALVGMMGRSPLIITAAPNAGIADAKALLAALKASPGKYSIATPGTGSPHHLAYELFQREAGVSMLHVPYKGGAPALQDLMGGQVALMMLDLPSGVSAVKAGKVVPLLAMSAERVPQLPNIPTARELGFANVEAYTWQGLVVPAATPKEVQAKLGTELQKAMADAGVRQKLYDAGWEARPADATEMTRYTDAERKKWHALIKARDIKLD